jgi:hypothetical protein
MTIAYSEGIDHFMFFNLAYVITALIGIYVTQRKLWTTDYFVLLFSIQIVLGDTIKFFSCPIN